MENKINLKSSVMRIALVFLWAVILVACSTKKVVENKSELQAPIVVENPVTSKTLESRAVQMVPMAHFSFDSAKLTKVAKALIHRQAHEFKKSSHAEILVVGGCDERGSLAYNQKLGMRRARSVRNELMRMGVAASLIQIKSVGKSQPIDEGHSEIAWALNRRAEMHISIRTPLASR